jgi:ADP-dependent NAD(P)H-hydrate dehydratase
VLELELVTPELLRRWPLPDPAGSKRSRGRVVVVGGAAATPGGVLLAGLASLRVGAGRVELAVARSVAPSLAAVFPEAGVRSLPETDGGSISGTAAAALLRDVVAPADAVLIGPGLDDAHETASLLTGLLPYIEDDTALVLDAYALGALSQSDEIAGLLTARDDPAVLTPNSQELGLLAGKDDETDEDDLPEVVQRYSCCVTSHSTVASVNGRSWHIPQGHPGLGTAGSGDVLAGLVVGLLGRGSEVEQAACWGTYLHSTAGERLSSTIGGVGFLARELVDQVPAILSELS